MILGVCAFVSSAQVTFIGSTKSVWEDKPAANTGLNKIYVLYNASGVSMKYNASTDGAVTWYRYGELGGGYAEEITGITRSGRESVLAQVVADCGYIIEEGTNRTYVWVTDYSSKRLTINSISVEPASDCGTATLNVSGSGDDIVFYTINGVRRVLSREIKVEYNTLEWDEESLVWNETTLTETSDGFKSTMVVPAPLCNTTFSISGDRFLKFWGENQESESDVYTTTAVDVRTTAVQAERDNDNEKKDEGGESLGGSAPVTITFKSYSTDAVIHKEWQMALDSEFEDIQLRLNTDDVEETFEEAGTTYWRFVASNDDGSCSAYGDVYTVNIGESELYCPNVFSPGLQDGVNDVWKVSYKSIIDFECHIFNRWGNEIIVLRDPSQGWDGRYRGKLVKSGVYFYVIRAEGSDGKKYNLKGDINILNYKKGLSVSGDDAASADNAGGDE